MIHSLRMGSNKPTGSSWKERLAYSNRLNNIINEIYHTKSYVSSSSYNSSVGWIDNNSIVPLIFEMFQDHTVAGYSLPL